MGDIDIRLGRWQDTLADVRADTLITDPPYSARTHRGHDAGAKDSIEERSDLGYEPWSQFEVDDFVWSWSGRVSGWFVVITDHELAPDFERALRQSERYVFAPLPFVARGSGVRLQGDGPSSWTRWIVVARPRTAPYSKWGTLPGAYVLPPGYMEKPQFTGGKPRWLMQALVRDYSKRGDLIVDPCAGSGTTLLAAVVEGRRAIGSEMDEATYKTAKRRLEQGFTPTFDFG
jgi:site-specific DNA-methyltransferase (adenine-specific)